MTTMHHTPRGVTGRRIIGESEVIDHGLNSKRMENSVRYHLISYLSIYIYIYLFHFCLLNYVMTLLWAIVDIIFF